MVSVLMGMTLLTVIMGKNMKSMNTLVVSTMV